MKFNILPVVSTLGENLPAERSLSRRRPVVASFRVPDLLPNEPGKCGGLRATGRRSRRRESLFSLPKGAGHAGGRGCRLPKTKRANERRLDTFTTFPVPLVGEISNFKHLKPLPPVVPYFGALVIGIAGEARPMHMHVAHPENATPALIGKLVSPQKKLWQNLGRRATSHTERCNDHED